MAKKIIKKTEFTFQRVEKKYLLSTQEMQELLNVMGDDLEEDIYGMTTVLNIYCDSPSDILITRSIQKPIYKEKLRIRSYGIPKEDSTVFMELKKKVLGVVYKRRLSIPLHLAMESLALQSDPECSQVGREIGYAIRMYQLEPKLVLSYDRRAYVHRENVDFRVTFDRNIRSRRTDLDLTHGASGALLLSPDQVLMEIKAADAMPQKLSSFLTKHQIFPTTFSKYGKVFEGELLEHRRNYHVI